MVGTWQGAVVYLLGWGVFGGVLAYIATKGGHRRPPFVEAHATGSSE